MTRLHFPAAERLAEITVKITPAKIRQALQIGRMMWMSMGILKKEHWETTSPKASVAIMILFIFSPLANLTGSSTRLNSPYVPLVFGRSVHRGWQTYGTEGKEASTCLKLAVFAVSDVKHFSMMVAQHNI
jgi:hypothetical protein